MKTNIEIDIDSMIDQALPQMSNDELQELAVKILKRMAGKTESVNRKPATKKIVPPNTNQPWSKEDKAKLKQKLESYHGNITEKRMWLLSRMFKRSKGAINTQIWIWRKKNMSNTKRNLTAEQRQKKSRWLRAVTLRASEIKRSEDIDYRLALKKAHRELKNEEHQG